MRQKVVFLSIALALLFSCGTKHKQNEMPVAEVGDRKLYISEIKDYLQNLSSKDSLIILTDYVNRWAKNQAVLVHAEKNLSDDEKNLDKEIDDYRTSLLVHKYEQAYIRAKMDTSINQAEIEQFYNDNPDNFQLPGMLVKALYIKAANDFKNMDKIRQLYRSNREKDIEELEKISISGVEAYSMFNEKWVNLSEVTAPLPGAADIYENRAIRMRTIEDSDDKYTYFIKINDISMKGTIAPLEHVKADIMDIIINRRKIQLIRQMENTVFNDAMNRNEIKINILN
ncbi:MAG: peptidyl-prolyl cis-trans isomerase [Prevotellaceae bacterium]|jgi:hypothetical protein|nr:peptidyl-prolyl cis-trans isomerase [Prevotellaceae bacterium]